MAIKTLSAADIISTAESHDGIQAGLVGLKSVLEGLSYQAASGNLIQREVRDNKKRYHWPALARTVLVLALHHPEENLGLDDWDRGDTRGNRRLREISKSLQYWLRWTYHVFAYPLPYNAKKGGIFLKDAAVLSGIGIIGRNNLVIHPKWGPRIRLHALLLENKFRTTGVLTGFSPCQTCGDVCRQACPQEAFSQGKYDRLICHLQLNADEANRVPVGKIRSDGKGKLVTRYCRVCELSCPVGA